MKRREKFCVILESVLSVDGSTDISLRNKMKMKSFYRDLFILRVNTEWLKKKLSSFSIEDLMKMKFTFHTLIKSSFSLFNDKTMEIRRNVWIFLGVLLESLLSLDENYPMKTLQVFLPFEIQDYILSLKEKVFSINLNQENEEVFAESLKMFIRLFSSLTSKYSNNSFIEIFLLERSNKRDEEDEESEEEEKLTDLFPKVNKYVHFFHSGWTSLKNSNHIIQHFLNILNVQQNTYHTSILPMYIRMTDDQNLRNLRFRYHISFQDYIEEKKKEIEKLFSKKQPSSSSTSSGILSYFFSSRYVKSSDDDKEEEEEENNNNKEEEEEEIKTMKKTLPIIISFITIFFTDPRLLTILLTQPNFTLENDLVVVEDNTVTKGKDDDDDDEEEVEKKEGKETEGGHFINTVKLESSLLGTFFSLCSILTSVRSHPNRVKKLDPVKFILSELCLHVVNIILGVNNQQQQQQFQSEEEEEEKKKGNNNNIHSLILFREDLRSNKLRRQHHNNLNLMNLIARICEHYLLNFTTRKGCDLESFKTSLNLLQHLFRELFKNKSSSSNSSSKIETRKITINYLRVWEILVGKLVKTDKDENTVTDELKESITSLIELCILEGEFFLHTDDRVSLVYELVRNQDDLEEEEEEEEKKSRRSDLIQFISENSKKMIETGPHSLGVWKRFILKDLFRKIDEWKVDRDRFIGGKKKEEIVLPLHTQIRNLKQCVCRLLSNS